MTSRDRKGWAVLIMLFLILGGAVDSALGEVVTHNFTGTITQISGTAFGLSLSIGQPVEGSIIYDPNGPVFDFGIGAGSIQPLPSGMSAIIGDVTVESAGVASLQVLNLPAGSSSFNACNVTPGARR